LLSSVVIEAIEYLDQLGVPIAPYTDGRITVIGGTSPE
jgi:hypothetical protein